MRVSVRSEKSSCFRKGINLFLDQPVHLMMESQDVEYLVLDVSPCRIISTVPTSSTEVDRLGSSLSPDRGPTILLDRREAEHENEIIFSRSLITTH